MAKVNIPRQKSDPFYRYQMPSLVVGSSGRGGSLTTTLVNISAVAEALHRSPTYIVKYFGLELSVPVHMDFKSNLYAIRGRHSQNLLQTLLDGFINLFVLCQSCENPETALIRHENQKNAIYQQCYACGSTRKIEVGYHRLIKFILNNWIEVNQHYTTYQSEENDSIESSTSQLNNDDDWDDQPSAVTSENLDVQIHEDCEHFVSLLKAKKLSNQLSESSAIEELITETERSKLANKASFYVIQYLFTDNIFRDITLYKALLYRLCNNNNQAQLSLLEGLETIISGDEENKLTKQDLLRILHKLYDQDIISEEIFYDWYDQKSKQLKNQAFATKIRNHAKEFIEWLQTADETSDEEEKDVKKIN